MSLPEALLLGLVQGLTEFLPISSSGHLVIVPALFRLSPAPVAFDAYLHAATLVAVVAYFRHEIARLLRGLRRAGAERRVIVLLIVATIPAAAVGAAFEESISRVFDRPAMVALLLVGTGVVLAASEAWVRRRPSVDSPGTVPTIDSLAGSVTYSRATTIGVAQAVAILPGFSRSGLTIGAGLFAGLDRPQAARFSFLLSIPILAGATAVKVPDLAAAHIGAAPLLVGGIAALVSGYLAVAGLIGYLQRRGLYPFAAYCLLAGPAYALLLR